MTDMMDRIYERQGARTDAMVAAEIGIDVGDIYMICAGYPVPPHKRELLDRWLEGQTDTPDYFVGRSLTYEQWRAGLTAEDARAEARTREAWYQGEQRALALRKDAGDLLPTAQVQEIADRLRTAITDHLGPSLHRSLAAYGVPEDVILRLRDDWYGIVASIWAEYAE